MALQNIPKNVTMPDNVVYNPYRQENIYNNVNNPYQQTGAPPKQSWFRQVLGWLGLGKTDSEREYDWNLASNQWQSEFNSSQADIFYNSPSNQASLMRDAGLNPDLQGITPFEAQSGENAANSPTDLTPVQGGLENFASSVSQGIQMFIGVRKGIMDIRELGIDIENKRSSFIKDTAESIAREIARDSYRSRGKDGEYVLDVRSVRPYLNRIKSRRLRSAVSDYFDNIWNSEYQHRLAYEEDAKNESARNEYIESASPYFDNDDMSIIKVLHDANKLRIDAQNYANKLGISDSLLKIKSSDWVRQSGYYKEDLTQDLLNKQQQGALMKYQNRIQEMQNNFYEKLNNDPSGIGQFILFNVLNSSGSSFLGDILSGAAKAIPQTRYFYHLR